MKILGVSLLVLLAVGAVVYVTACPCGPVPGAWLFGDRHEGQVTDWSFVNDRKTVPLCQVQIDTWRPHSINLNCMAEEGDLYVSCSNCATKAWSNDALVHPDGYIRAASIVYPVSFSRVTDQQQLDVVWQARLEKINGEEAPRPGHWWSFRLVSR